MILNKNPQTGFKFSLFDEDASINAVLKNPNEFKEAVIFEYMSHKDPTTLRSFIHSPEAKAMIEAGAITYDTLDRLENKCRNPHAMNAAICHVAKENEDELWDELIKVRAEERRLLNALRDKYADKVGPLANNARDEIIAKYIPDKFK